MVFRRFLTCDVIFFTITKNDILKLISISRTVLRNSMAVNSEKPMIQMTEDPSDPAKPSQNLTKNPTSSTTIEPTLLAAPAADASMDPPMKPKPKKVSRKVILKPGHSLTHWVDRSKSGEDMTGYGGSNEDRVITKEELAKHNKIDDAWIAVRGKVYNLTKYLDYHPGGVEILLNEAGKEATDLFDKNHRWVNIDRLLGSCQVGKLKTLSLVI